MTNNLSSKDEEIINSLKKELEEVRKKKEKAIGPEVYNYYWEREKKLEELVSTLVKHRQIAEEARARKSIPKVDIEELRKWLFEGTGVDKTGKDETVRELLKKKKAQ
jgi:vacuolar-type H+-ATPase subunit I/STV1